MSIKLEIPLLGHKLILDQEELARVIYGATEDEWEELQEGDKEIPRESAERLQDYLLALLDGRTWVP